MLIRDVEIEGEPGLDVRLAGARIARVGRRLAAEAGERVVAGRGGALLPGLHDHHIHLHALAAARASVRCGPPQVRDEAGLAAALRAAGPGAAGARGWIRGVGYHESVAGELDAARLDAIVPLQPVRVQHRSGALWILNRAGLAALGLAGALPAGLPDGVERDARGRATGRLFRADDWLRERLAGPGFPDLAEVGAALARFGVTGVTDATPGNDGRALAAFSEAVASGALRQRVLVLGRPGLPCPGHPDVAVGAVKLVLAEHALPHFDALERCIAGAHAEGRAAAIHCVTRAELALAVAALAAAGSEPGDRIEHASVAPPELAERLAELGACVVTQPNFVRERGDAYRRDVDPADRPWLYRCRGLVEVGVPLGAGTDAPFGDPDPWLAVQAALDRRTRAGESLAAREALSPERALALFTTRAESPGGAPRRVAPGEAADLCLLDRAWSRARDRLASEDVAGTWSRGVPTWLRDGARDQDPVDV